MKTVYHSRTKRPLALLLVLMVALTATATLTPEAMPLSLEEAGSPVAGDLVPDQALVVFVDSVPADIDTFVAPYGSVIQRNDTLRFATVQAAPEAIPRLLAALESRDDVEAAHRPTYYTIQFTPNDPLYDSQWGLPAIGLPAAWDITLGSHATKVAVLDTGTAYLHPDLMANTMLGDPMCGPDLDVIAPGTLPLDDHGHGTHVAGTIAALTDNDLGVAGVSQSCIQTVKVLNSEGFGTVAHIALGILHATETGARVISMSLGGPTPSILTRSAVEHAWREGVLVIAAAGNSGCEPGSNTVSWPARFPEVMAVASLSSPTQRSGFSSCGPEVEISAPGSGILSTCGALIEHSYCSFSGTSMATPHISGVAGLMFDVNPALTNHQARCILQVTAVDLGDPGRDRYFGYGRVDAQGAVIAASDPASIGC